MRYLFFIFMVVTPQSHAQLAGLIRKNFLECTVQNCYSSQRSSTINKSLSNETINKYCKCTAVYVADYLNNELILSIERGEQKLNMSIVNLAANFCRKNYQDY
jgi:hypothetical protein